MLGELLVSHENYASPFSAGDIVTTPEDLRIFMGALISERILNTNTLGQLSENMNLYSDQKNPSVYYGKGILLIHNSPDGDLIGHSGHIIGFQTALFFHLPKKIVLAAMLNDEPKPNRREAEPAVFSMLETILANE